MMRLPTQPLPANCYIPRDEANAIYAETLTNVAHFAAEAERKRKYYADALSYSLKG